MCSSLFHCRRHLVVCLPTKTRSPILTPRPSARSLHHFYPFQAPKDFSVLSACRPSLFAYPPAVKVEDKKDK